MKHLTQCFNTWGQIMFKFLYLLNLDAVNISKGNIFIHGKIK